MLEYEIFKVIPIEHHTVFYPTDILLQKVCSIIDESDLFVYLEKSRIDGYPIYRLKWCTRFIKIQKILKNDIFINKIKKIKKDIKKDIKILSKMDIMEESPQLRKKFEI